MQLTPLQSPKSADVPVERLANHRALSEEQKVEQASRAFESLLLRQILEEAQKTVIPSSISSDSTTSQIYRGMVAEQLADSISKSGAFGLAVSLRNQISPATSHGHQQEHPAELTTSAGADRTSRAATNRQTGSTPAHWHNPTTGKP